MSGVSSLLGVGGFFGKGRYGLAGHGKVTNPNRCGHYRYKICDLLDLHNRVGGLLGVDYRDRSYAKPIFFSCGKPSCPICHNSCCIREAAKACGLKVEHISVSAPLERYCDPDNFDARKARGEAIKALKTRGIIGGCVVFHAARFKKKRKVWRWEVHYHCLGFIRGKCEHDGYNRCRQCRFNAPMGRKHCWDCEGFEGITRRANLKDGMIVKVLDRKHERKTIWGTAKYELSHATIDYSKRRSHVVTWFGVCSYRKLKVDREKKKNDLCPICKHELVWGRYRGSRIFDKNSPDFKHGFLVDYYENGRPAWLRDETYHPDIYLG